MIIVRTYVQLSNVYSYPSLEFYNDNACAYTSEEVPVFCVKIYIPGL